MGEHGVSDDTRTIESRYSFEIRILAGQRTIVVKRRGVNIFWIVSFTAARIDEKSVSLFP